MEQGNSFRDSALVKAVTEHIRKISHKPAKLMEFCGGHTVAIMRYGLRQLLPESLSLLSGPGCPVCVTATGEIDRVIQVAQSPGVTLATFGDLIRVPGSELTLEEARAGGAAVKVVYSASDALNLARKNPDTTVVFTAIGFETTAPTVAAAILEAAAGELVNFKVISLLKLCPPVMKALLDRGEVNISGIILPGHVSAVIGSHPFSFLPADYRIGGVVSGFEPLDILQAISMLMRQIEEGKPVVEIAYRRGVKPEGNRAAQEIMECVFEASEGEWRGLGKVAESGLKIKKEYRQFDADNTYQVRVAQSREKPGCSCGEVLRGVMTPPDCPLFGSACRPERPVGPCMVSSEGACAAYYQYRGMDG